MFIKLKAVLESISVTRINIFMKQKSYLIFFIGLILGAGIIYLTSLSHKTDGNKISENKEVTAVVVQSKKDIKDFDFWKLECEENKKNCKIIQTLSLKQKTKNNESQTVLALNLMLYIMQGKDGQKRTRIRFITPLGLDLTAGLALRVDEGKEYKVPFQFCHADGCLTDFNLGDDVLLEMKKGKSILVGYKLPNAKPIILKASLKGITAAYDALLETAN